MTHDLLDYASSGATVLAAGLALLSIEQNRRQARKAERALLQERRVDFYLDQLLDVDEGVMKASQTVIFAAESVHRGLRVLPVSMLPLTRAIFALAPTPEQVALREPLTSPRPGTSLLITGLPAMQTEITAEVALQLATRSTLVSQPLAKRRYWPPLPRVRR